MVRLVLCHCVQDSNPGLPSVIEIWLLDRFHNNSKSVNQNLTTSIVPLSKCPRRSLRVKRSVHCETASGEEIDLCYELRFRESNKGQSKPDPRLQPLSCLLLKQAPPRGGKKPKTDARANLHVLVDFGFQVFSSFIPA